MSVIDHFVAIDIPTFQLYLRFACLIFPVISISRIDLTGSPSLTLLICLSLTGRSVCTLTHLYTISYTKRNIPDVITTKMYMICGMIS